MTDDEPEEPTDEDVMEVLGDHGPGDTHIPQGREAFKSAEDSVHEFKAHQVAHDSANVDASRQVKGDKGGAIEAGPSADAREDEVPTLLAAVSRLPLKWQRVYIIALHEHGDPTTARRVASATCGLVTPSLVAKASRECAEFAAMILDHGQIQHESVFSAIYRGATEGDRIPYSTKDGVQWYNRRSDRAGEIWLKAHGLMADQQSSLHVTHSGKVDVQHDDQLGGVLADIAGELFGRTEPRAIEGKVVSEPDKNEG